MSGSKGVGQDVRFLSNQCWIWWPKPLEIDQHDGGEKINCLAECIDGDTGLRVPIPSHDDEIEGGLLKEVATIDASTCSEASTFSFTKSFSDLLIKMNHEKAKEVENMICQNYNDEKTTITKNEDGNEAFLKPQFNLSLKNLKRMKRLLSPEYEHAKDVLLQQHVVFRHWRRRFNKEEEI